MEGNNKDWGSNETETKRRVSKINEMKVNLWKMKLRSVLARLTKRGKKDRRLKKRNERGVLSGFTETPRIIRNCCCYVTSVVSNSVRPHRQQPTSLPRSWGSPGKNTGVGCHFLLQCMKVKTEREVVQSCLTLSNPMDCSPPGSSIHGIFQARVLEWGAIAFSE